MRIDRPTGKGGERRDALPWYKQGWPWFVIALPAIAVIAGIATLIIALRGADGVVAEDYYKRGLAINEELSRGQRAAELGIRARIELAGVEGGDAVRVQIRADDTLPATAVLRVRLVHPGSRDADRVALLGRAQTAADGRSASFAGQWNDARRLSSQPAWRVLIETDHWRLDGELPAQAQPARRFELQAR